MPKYFPGITHCLVRTAKSAEEMTATNGILAEVALCFGEDFDRMGPIRIKKLPGPTTGVMAAAPKTLVVYKDKKIWYPTLQGKVADEAKMLALVAFDSVKQKFGIKYNKTYKVTGKIVEDTGVINAQCSSGVGQQSTA